MQSKRFLNLFQKRDMAKINQLEKGDLYLILIGILKKKDIF